MGTPIAETEGGNHFSDTVGGRARQAHMRQIRLAERVAGSGNVAPEKVQKARLHAVAAMDDVISQVYRGIHVEGPKLQAIKR